MRTVGSKRSKKYLNPITASIRALSRKHFIRPLLIGAVALGTVGISTNAMATYTYYDKGDVSAKTLTGVSELAGEETKNAKKKADLSYFSVYGQHTDSSAITSETSVKMSGGQIYDLYGAYSEEGNIEGTVNVTMSSGTIDTSLNGAYSDKGDITGTVNVTMSGGTDGYLYGAYSDKGDITGTVNVTMSDGTISRYLYGAKSGYSVEDGEGDISNVTVNMSGGTVAWHLYGAHSGESLGSISNVIVEMSNGSVGSEGNEADLHGAYSSKGTISNVEVSLSGGNVWGDLYGAESSSGAISDVNVTLNAGGSVGGALYGAYSSSGNITVEENESVNVTISGGTVGEDLYGAYSSSGNITGTKEKPVKVVMNGGTVGDSLYGAYSAYKGDVGTKGNISNVTVEMSGGTIEGGLKGASSGSGKIKGNVSVTMSGGTIEGYLCGAESKSGNITVAEKERVNVILSGNAKVVDSLYGAYAEYMQEDKGKGNISNVSVNVRDTAYVGGALYGAWAFSGDISNAAVNMSGGKVLFNLYGAYSSPHIKTEGDISTEIKNVTVNVNGTACADNYLFGVYSSPRIDTTGTISTNISDVTVTVSGNASVREDVCGVFFSPRPEAGTISTTISDVSVILKDSPTLKGVDLYGWDGALPPQSEVTGVTLEVWTNSIKETLKSVQNFDNYLFVLPQSAISSNGTAAPMLSVGTAVDLKDAKVAVTVANGVTVANEAKAILIDNVENAPIGKALKPSELKKADGTTSYTLGRTDITDFLEGDIMLSVEGSKLLATFQNVKSNGSAKSVAESALGSVSLLTEGTDLVAGDGIASAGKAAKKTLASGGNGASAFGAMGGGASRYKTGSHVDMKSVGFVAGFAKNLSDEESDITLGTFLEAGYGDYDTENEGKSGDGKTRYYGIGLMGRVSSLDDNGPYVEASARFGQSENEWNSNAAATTKYDEVKGLYYGAHFTLGYEGKLENNWAYDIYGKFLWTHQNGDDTDVNGAKFKFKDTDSLKTRLGMKFTQENTEGFSPYVGLAWEHEFDGKAKATVNGLAIEEPKLKGDTGVVDIGFNYTPEENAGWSVGFKATGYFGQRRGGAGQILFKSEF